MELNQYEAMISFATGCKYSSLNYIDYEDVQTAEVICYDESLLLLYMRSENFNEIHYATNDLEELLKWIKAKNLIGLVKFIPFDKIAQFELNDFKIHCAFQDFLLKDLKQVSKLLENEFEIQFATVNEAKSISEISQKCAGLSRGFFGETEEWIKDWISENKIIVKYNDCEMVGFCCVSIYAEGSTLWIRELAVHPDFQGKGFGKDLLEMSLKYGIQNGAQKSFLAVDIENKRAIQLYKYFGYEAKENEIEVQMVKI